MNIPPEKIPESAFLERQVLDQLPDTVVVVNTFGIVTYVNPAFEKISGYPLTYVINKHFTTLPFFHKGDIPQYIKIFASLVKGEIPEPFEIEWIHKDGSTHYSEVRIIVSDKLTASAGFIAITRERTQEVFATRKLAKTLTLLEKSQSIGKIGSWEFNLKTNELQWTDELYRIYGIDREEKPSLEKFLELIHPDDLKRVEALWDNSLLQAPFENEFRIVTIDKIKWIHSYTETIYDKIGTAIRVFGTEQDVSQRKFAEQELYESELKYHNIFDSINDGLFFHDATTGKIIDVNNTASEMLGYTSEELLKSTVGELSANVPPYTQKEAVHWIQKAAAGKPQRFEWHFKHKSGHLFWVEINMRLVQYNGSKQVIVAVRDIDESKQNELNLAGKARELEDFNNAMVDREMRMIELKREINELCKQMNIPARYPAVWDDGNKDTLLPNEDIIP